MSGTRTTRWRAGPALSGRERARFEAVRCWATFGAVFAMTALVAALGYAGGGARARGRRRRLNNATMMMTDNTTTTGICHANRVSDPLQLQGAGFAAFYVLGICFMFLAIHTICEHHFVPVLDVVTQRTSLPPDVVGATFMAAGSSAPELFASLMGVIFQNARDVGVGTVVGSTVFNMLIIVGVSVLISPGQTIHVSGRSMFRDGFFYLLSLVVLVAVIADGTLSVADAGGMVCLYVVYIVALMNWSMLRNRVLPGCLRCFRCPVPEGFTDTPKLGKFHDLEKTDEDDDEAAAAAAASATAAAAAAASAEGEDEGSGSTAGAEADATARRAATEVDAGGPRAQPLAGLECCEGCVKFTALIMYPISTCFRFTVPAPRSSPTAKPTYPRMCASFTCCLLWLFVLVFFMIEWAEKVGCLINISESVMGLTVTAIGTSAPDAIASFLTARKDKEGGKMAISNVFGSNIFDILLALGLPVLLFSGGQGVPLDLTENFPSVVILFVILVLLFVILATSTPQLSLTLWVGWLHVSMYAGYILFVIIDDVVSRKAGGA